jgi:hypothetical protein
MAKICSRCHHSTNHPHRCTFCGNPFSTENVHVGGLVSPEEQEAIRERELATRFIPSPIQKTSFKAVKTAVEKRGCKKSKARSGSGDGFTKADAKRFAKNLKKQRPLFRKLVKALEKKHSLEGRVKSGWDDRTRQVWRDVTLKKKSKKV